MDISVFFGLLVIYIYISCGVVLGLVLKKYRDFIQKWTTALLINIITPIQIFLSISTASFQLSFLTIFKIAIFAFSSYLIISLTSTYYFKRKSYPGPQLGSAVLTSTFPNAFYYVVPIINAFFTDDLLVFPIIYIIVMILVKSTILPFQAQSLGSENTESTKERLKRILLFPPLIGIIFSFIVVAIQVPLPLESMTQIKPILSQISSIISAILIGIILSKVNLPGLKNNIYLILNISLFRFVFSFLFFLCSLLYLNFPIYQNEIRTILLIVVCAPPAVNNIVYSIFFGFDEKLTATTISILTFIGLILLPGFLLFCSVL